MSLLNPWVLLGILAAVVASAVGGCLFGMDVQNDRHAAQLLVQEQAMRDAFVARVKEFRAIAQGVSKELNDEQGKRQADKLAFDDELRRSRARGSQLAVCQPSAPSLPTNERAIGNPAAAIRLPEPRLTGEFARLYDLALGIGVSGAGDPGRTDARAEGSDSVDPADVLANAADNAEAWAECRSTVRGWQALARRYGWVK